MTWGRGSTRAWRTLRTLILQRDPLCQLRLHCCTVTSLEVDHIINVADGGTNDPLNLRGVCPPCHAAKTKAEAARGRAKARARRQPTAKPHPGARISPDA